MVCACCECDDVDDALTRPRRAVARRRSAAQGIDNLHAGSIGAGIVSCSCFAGDRLPPIFNQAFTTLDLENQIRSVFLWNRCFDPAY
jgi:hypothetical protein